MADAQRTFFLNMGCLMDIGMPMTQILPALAEDCADPALAAAIRSATKRLEKDETLAEAFAEAPFPPWAHAMIAAGDAGGILDTLCGYVVQRLSRTGDVTPSEDLRQTLHALELILLCGVPFGDALPLIAATAHHEKLRKALQGSEKKLAKSLGGVLAAEAGLPGHLGRLIDASLADYELDGPADKLTDAIGGAVQALHGDLATNPRASFFLLADHWLRVGASKDAAVRESAVVLSDAAMRSAAGAIGANLGEGLLAAAPLLLPKSFAEMIRQIEEATDDLDPIQNSLSTFSQYARLPAETPPLARALYGACIIGRRLSVPRGLELVAADESGPLGTALANAARALLASGSMADTLAEHLAPHHVGLLRFGEAADALLDAIERVSDDLLTGTPRTPELDLALALNLFSAGVARSNAVRGWNAGGRMPETTPMGRIVALAGEAIATPGLREAFLAAARKGTRFGESLGVSGAGIPPAICEILLQTETEAPGAIGDVAAALSTALRRGRLPFSGDATLVRDLRASFALLQASLATGAELGEAVAALPAGRVADAFGDGTDVVDSMAKHPDLFSHAAIEAVRIGEETGSIDIVLGKLSDGMDDGAFLPA